MRLYNLSRRDKFYNEGLIYEPIPCARIPVCPGQSQAMDMEVKFQTAPFTKNLLASGLASVFLFYVPNRLVWDDWTGFIAQDDDFAGTFPTTTTVWANVFDRENPGGNFSSLYRRAYKLCYNEFFGDKQSDQGSSDTWYSDITQDTDIQIVGVKTTEQFSGRLVTDNAIQSPTYSASPIDLNDFHRAMQNARSQRRANMSGDKYVDSLRRMGVEPDWRIQMAPEFLCRSDQEFFAAKTFDTSDTGTGDSRARFEGTINVKCPSKMFAEHGYIVGMFVMRPHVFNTALDCPADGLMRTIEDFYLADNLRDQDVYDQQDWCTTPGTDDIFVQRFAVYRNGAHIHGDGSTWCLTYNPNIVENVLFPDQNSLPTDTTLGSNEVAIYSAIHSRGKTPIPANAL